MELEETLYWLELLEEAGIIPGSKLSGLKGETSELSAIFVTLIKQARENELKREVETRWFCFLASDFCFDGRFDC